MAMESDIDDIDFEVVDVNAHSLGIDGIDPETFRRTNVIMLPRNTRRCRRRSPRSSSPSNADKRQLPFASCRERIPNRTTAPSVGRDRYSRTAARTCRRGWPIEVTFEYGTNGRLNVSPRKCRERIAISSWNWNATRPFRKPACCEMEGNHVAWKADSTCWRPRLEDIAAEREQRPAKSGRLKAPRRSPRKGSTSGIRRRKGSPPRQRDQRRRQRQVPMRQVPIAPGSGLLGSKGDGAATRDVGEAPEVGPGKCRA